MAQAGLALSIQFTELLTLRASMGLIYKATQTKERGEQSNNLFTTLYYINYQ
jgi:hypothetical protein